MTIEKVLEKILEELQTLNAKIPAVGGTEFPAAPIVKATSTAPAQIAAPAAAPAPVPAAPAVDPASLRPAVGQALIKLAELDYEAANTALRKFGAPSPALGEINPAQYGELLAHVLEQTAALAKKASLL